MNEQKKYTNEWNWTKQTKDKSRYWWIIISLQRKTSPYVSFQVLVVFLNGGHTKSPDRPSVPLNLATKNLRIKGVDIFAVGIPEVSGVDYNELSDIVTKPENAMTAKKYEEAAILAEDVAKMACGKWTKFSPHSFTLALLVTAKEMNHGVF